MFCYLMNLIRLKICRVHIWSADVPFVVNFQTNASRKNNNNTQTKLQIRSMCTHCCLTFQNVYVREIGGEKSRQERKQIQNRMNIERWCFHMNKYAAMHSKVNVCVCRYIYKMPPVRFIGVDGVCVCCYCCCSIAISLNRYTHTISIEQIVSHFNEWLLLLLFFFMVNHLVLFDIYFCVCRSFHLLRNVFLLLLLVCFDSGMRLKCLRHACV